MKEVASLVTSNPLHGVSIVLTRPKGRSRELMTALQSMGATVVEMPLIETKAISNPEVTDVLSLQVWDGVVVTSANAVRSAYAICLENKKPFELGGIDWYCIGEGTAKAVQKLGLKPHVFDNVRNGMDFANALVQHLQDEPHLRLLFLHGQKADLSLCYVLRSAGIRVDELTVYDTVDAAFDVHMLDNMQKSRMVGIVFFSPSAVQSLIRQWPSFCNARTYRTFVVTIGQTTQMASEKLCVLVDQVAKRPTPKSVADAIVAAVNHYKDSNGGK